MTKDKWRKVILQGTTVMYLGFALMTIGAYSSSPDRPLQITWRPATPDESRQWERDNLEDTMRAYN